MKFGFTIRNIYLYTFSAAGLIMSLVAISMFLQTMLTTYVFPAEEYGLSRPLMKTECSIMTPGTPDVAGTSRPCTDTEYEQRRVDELEWQKRNAKNDLNWMLARSISLILVGGPLFLYHWSLIRREAKGK